MATKSGKVSNKKLIVSYVSYDYGNCYDYNYIADTKKDKYTNYVNRTQIKELGCGIDDAIHEYVRHKEF